MLRTILSTIIATSLMASAVSAGEQRTRATYNISSKTSVVEGTFTVDGYSPQKMLTLIAQDCNGKVGKMSLVGEPFKKKGHVFQRFTTTCSGGLADKHSADSGKFAVLELSKGRDQVKYMLSGGSSSGKILKEVRKE